ncbi:MAG: hypothetical protein ACJ8GK_00630 [Luteimonas sp.]
MLPKAHAAFNLACAVLLAATVVVLCPQLLNSDSAAAILLGGHAGHAGGWIDKDWAYVSDSLMLDGRLQVAMLGMELFGRMEAAFVFVAAVGAVFALSATYMLARLLGASRSNAVTAGLALLLGPSLIYLDVVVGLAVSIQIGVVLCFVAALVAYLFGRGGALAIAAASAILLAMTMSSPMKAIAYCAIPTIAACVAFFACSWIVVRPDRALRSRLLAVVLVMAFAAAVGAGLHRLLLAGVRMDTSYAKLSLALTPEHLLANLRLFAELALGFAGSRNAAFLRLLPAIVAPALLVVVLAPLATSRWREFLTQRQGFVYFYAVLGALEIVAYILTYQSIKPHYGIYYLLPPACALLAVAASSATADGGRLRASATKAALLALLACGAANAAYLLAVPPVGYSGMSIKQRTTHRDQRLATAWLLAHHLRRGFATYWEANTITMLSDGAIQATAIRTPAGGRMVRRMIWLTSRQRAEYMPRDGRWFILLPVRQRSARLPATCLPPSMQATVGGNRIYVFDRPMPGCLQSPPPFLGKKRVRG